MHVSRKIRKTSMFMKVLFIFITGLQGYGYCV